MIAGRCCVLEVGQNCIRKQTHCEMQGQLLRLAAQALMAGSRAARGCFVFNFYQGVWSKGGRRGNAGAPFEAASVPGGTTPRQRNRRAAESSEGLGGFRVLAAACHRQ